jgi:transcriptional regulator with XRE-family HTH domain
LKKSNIMKKKNKDLEKLIKEQREILGNRMKELRMEKNMTQEELQRRMEETEPDERQIEREIKKLGMSAKYFREKKNMTLQEVADICELSVDTIQRFENGDRQSDYDTMVLICYALEISIYDLANISDVIEP